MDISIITCNNALNYGARLQTYALSAYLRSIGHSPTVIDYCPRYVQFATRLWYVPSGGIKEWIKLLVRYPQRRSDITKHSVLQSFSAQYTSLTSTTYTDIEQLRTDPPAADVYIAGSDQIWNTSFPNGTDPAYYLDFGPADVRRLSYAASFAIPSLPDVYKGQVRSWLSNFDAITVREESAVEICRDMGFRATMVCDPVFLLDANQWTEIADNAGYGEHYLLVYDFERNPDLKRVAQRVARLRGLKIYSVSPYRLPYAQRNYSCCSPETFVSLIKNASCVVSNSLHGSIFSMVFRRDFFVVNRDDGLNVRMRDLLGRYGLQHLTVSPDTDDATLCSVIDYGTVSDRLEADIRASKEHLSNMLVP